MSYAADDLVHVANWQQFVRYVREDRRHADNWRPPYVNLGVSEILDARGALTNAQFGSFVQIVAEYASSPLLDPLAGPQSARRLTFERASRTLGTRGKHASQTWEALNHAGLIVILPGRRRDGQQQSREVQDLRPSRARAAAPVEDQDPKIGEETAAAGSPASESEIREAVASLRGADRGSLNGVEPLASSVPRETFVELVERARGRGKRNPVGWLIRRLQAAIDEERIDRQSNVAVVEHALAQREPVSIEEALEANVRQYVTNGHPWGAVADEIAVSFGDEYLEAARAIFDRAHEAKAAA